MSESPERAPEEPGVGTDAGGENVPPPESSSPPTHEGAPHDREAHEPLGPMTPDEDRPLGDTPEAHDDIIPEDLPKDHPARREAERQAGEGDGTVRGTT
jgi:hypothetical protein